MWTSSKIRETFLQFFAEKGHKVVPSSSLVPDDPTLLFTNAGMVQFKNVFLGLEKPSYSRAATAQKCLRVSGKHNDLENVGPSLRHHTFFEMLGNFSFGDYFKREAITYAWELLTEVYGLPKERFHFTIYCEDDESFKLWQEIAGASEEKIHRMGEKTNFWMMGDTGPCGPNTELVWDRGPQHCTCKLSNCSPHLDNDCDRWWELWNLVFMQYEQAPDGTRTPLPKPGVDTGMGFERLVAVLQGAPTNYDTDLFQPILQKIREMQSQRVGESKLHRPSDSIDSSFVPYRVIADHSRAMTFLLADGVVPGNEERNYVLRMIMRRAIRFGKKLGFKAPFLGQVAQVVIDTMGGHYHEIKDRKDFILRAIAQEEERSERTLNAGLGWLEELLERKERKGGKVITGSEAFYGHDTLGLHIEIIEDVARERGFSVDRKGFETEMKKQRERSRETISRANFIVTVTAQAGLAPTKFVGYKNWEWETELVFINKEEQLFAFKETPFYAEGGGQIADTGWIENLSRRGRAEVLDVQKDGRDIYLHRVRVIEGEFHAGDRCLLEVDIERRKRTMRNHTATHILHAALQRVLGGHAKQAGSLVAPDELRFDFTHLAPLTEDEIQKIEELANRVILEDLPVSVTFERLEDAKARGAMALFTEDYQGKDKVRVVTIAPLPGDEKPFSIELCGGTHVKSTGQIGLFKLISEEGIAAGVRRVRVATGFNLISYIAEKEKQIKEIAALAKVPEKEVVQKVEAILKEKEHLEKQLEHLKHQLLLIKRDELLRQRKKMEVKLLSLSLICAKADLEAEELKKLADLLEGALDRGIVILGSSAKGRVTLVCKVSRELTDHYQADKIIKAMTPIVKGGGGGSAQFAHGGGSDPSKLEEALKAGEKLVKTKATS